MHVCVRVCSGPLLVERPYIESFKRKMNARDKRRVQKNKALDKYKMVKKTINKKTGKVQVNLGR